MGTKNIFLIRHGESAGNLDINRYATDKDHNVPLTEFGYQQALNAGKFLKKHFDEHPELKDKKIRVYYSPYLRTRQTLEGILEGAEGTIDKTKIVAREDSLLRERDYGIFSLVGDKESRQRLFPLQNEFFEQLNAQNGKYYARPPQGESLADTNIRTELFKDKLMGSLDRNEDVDVAIIVSHDSTLKCFEKSFFHKDVAWFEAQPKFPNCGVKLIQQTGPKSYRSDLIYSNEKRLPNLPADYKSQAYGETAHATSQAR